MRQFDDGMELDGQLVLLLLLQYLFLERPEFPLHRGAWLPGSPRQREVLAIQGINAASTEEDYHVGHQCFSFGGNRCNGVLHIH